MMNDKNEIELPDGVMQIIKKLESAGYEAYAVGGCVRDSILGIEPHDWDICTNAMPQEIKSVFCDLKYINIGIRYGTVAVVLNSISYEITTYRVDGDYSNNRQPDTVKFVGSLKEDLSRRDFTINAMAYNPSKGLVDYFGGQDDIQAKLIRCVGNADERFREDALRMLRAIRFAICKKMDIEPKTKNAIIKNADLIVNVSRERVHDELFKTFATGTDLSNVDDKIVLLVYLIDFVTSGGANLEDAEFDAGFLNELLSFTDENTSVYVKLALLFDWIVVFFDDIQDKFKLSNEEMRHITNVRDYSFTFKLLIFNQSEPSFRETLLLAANQIGYTDTALALECAGVWEADFECCNIAKNAIEKLNYYVNVLHIPYKVSQLAIDGNDLILMGLSEGKKIGKLLNDILRLVMRGELNNDRTELLEYAKGRM